MSKTPTQGTHFLELVIKNGVRVEAPFLVRLDGEEIEFDAYLPDFGGVNGMVLAIGGRQNIDTMSKFASRAGLYFSSLNAKASVSDQSVKDTLDDWGYFGTPERRPAWYTGCAWGTK